MMMMMVYCKNYTSIDILHILSLVIVKVSVMRVADVSYNICNTYIVVFHGVRKITVQFKIRNECNITNHDNTIRVNTRIMIKMMNANYHAWH